MKNKILYKILTRLVDVRPEETLTSVLMFFYFFLITSPAYIIKPVRISLFLGWLTAERLPYAYLLTALLIGLVVTLNTKLLRRLQRQLYISLSLVFFISNLFLFWVLFKKQWPWLSMIYWFWTDVFIISSVTQFWIVVNDIYHLHQAKRLVGFFVSGGLLGGIAGSIVASRLAKIIGTENLLLICPLLLIWAVVIVNFVYKAHPYQVKDKKEAKISQSRAGYGQSFQIVRKSRYLLILAGIMAAAVVVTTLIDFQFNTIVELVYPEKDIRTSFLGTFFTALLIFSYCLHLLATNRILKNFGIKAALLVAPLFLILASISLFLVPLTYLIYWAVIIKGGDKSLSHSLSQSVRELLYIPVSPEIKYKAKVFIDMFVNKLAKGLAAFLILIFFSGLHFNLKEMSLVTLAFIAVWVLLISWINREYVGIVKRKLKIKWPDADKFIKEKIDIDMTKLVFDTIQSKERSSILYAMNLFDLIKSKNLSPELKKIIHYKSDEIRASSLDSLLELDGEALLPEADDSLNKDSLDIQVKEIMSLDVYQQVLKEHLKKILDKESSQDEVSRMEAAKLLGMIEPASPLVNSLSKLLRDDSPEVIRYALESAGKLKKREFVPFIIQNLTKSTLEREAGTALVEYGPKILGILKDYLADTEEDLHLRQAIPDIMARINTPKAAYLLCWELKKEEEEVAASIIKALYKLRTENPKLRFPQKIVMNEIFLMIKRCYLILMELHDFKGEKKRATLIPALEKDLAHSLQQIFELLSLIYPQEDIIKAYQNISAGTKKSIDYSLELLDNILKREIKEFLLPLIDDLPLEDKFKRCRKLLKGLDKNIVKSKQ